VTGDQEFIAEILIHTLALAAVMRAQLPADCDAELHKLIPQTFKGDEDGINAASAFLDVLRCARDGSAIADDDG